MRERWVDELMPDQPQWVRDLVDEELRKRDARLSAAEALLRDCYSPVRRIANGGSRTREDLDKAEATLARLDAFLKETAHGS